MTIETKHTPYSYGPHGYIYYENAVVVPFDFGEHKAALWVRILNAAYQRGYEAAKHEKEAK